MEHSPGPPVGPWAVGLTPAALLAFLRPDSKLRPGTLLAPRSLETGFALPTWELVTSGHWGTRGQGPVYVPGCAWHLHRPVGGLPALLGMGPRDAVWTRAHPNDVGLLCVPL